MDSNSFSKEIAGAESEMLLLSSQVMLNELARRYLESRQKDKEFEQTATNTQSVSATQISALVHSLYSEQPPTRQYSREEVITMLQNLHTL